MELLSLQSDVIFRDFREQYTARNLIFSQNCWWKSKSSGIWLSVDC